MKASTIWIIAVAVVLIAVSLTIAGMYATYHNQEVMLRNLITNKQTDNTSEFDNMWKKISQVAQVSEKDRASLRDIFVAYAEARTGTENEKAIMDWVQESVPAISSDTMKNLQNIITASRDAWTMRQKELIDAKREHDNLIDKFPSNLFIGNRGKIDIKVITSTKTEKVFDERKDDDTKVF
jgi:hypothetical protein